MKKFFTFLINWSFACLIAFVIIICCIGIFHITTNVYEFCEANKYPTYVDLSEVTVRLEYREVDIETGIGFGWVGTGTVIKITDDYTALYIHNATQSNALEDCVFYYKARPVKEGWKLGCNSYWQFHADRYNPGYVETANYG